MQNIQNETAKALETLARPTRENQVSTQELERWNGTLNARGWRNLNDPSLEKMGLETARFLHEITTDAVPRWLSFCGTSGAGKTMLARIIRQIVGDKCEGKEEMRLNNAGRAEIKYRKGGFLNWGNAINNRMLKGDYDFLEDLQNYWFFVIDDIASEHERHRELSAAKLYQVLEARMGKWTVITSNLHVDQIGEKLDARIGSRLLREGNTVVDVDVEDFNLRANTVPNPAGGEPEGFRAWFDSTFASRAGTPWPKIPESVRAEFRYFLKGHLA
jgi:DNA replication protein DnaC